MLKDIFQKNIDRYDVSSFLLYGLLLITALGARLYFLFVIDTPTIFFKYVVFAHKIIQGQDIGERLLDMSPFYLVWMTAIIKYFNPDFATLKLLQACVGIGNTLLIFMLGRLVFSRITASDGPAPKAPAGIFADRAAFVSALLYALYGNIIILETTFEPFVFVLFFNMLAVWCLLHAKLCQGINLRCVLFVLAAGLFSGLSIITKPNFLLFLPFGAGWFFLNTSKRLSLRQKALPVLIFLVAVLLFVAPVAIRNYVKFNDFILVTADYGKVFFHGNARGADGLNPVWLAGQDIDPSGNQDPDYAHVFFREKAAKQVGHYLRPSEAARFWFMVTFRDILSKPWSHIVLEFKKLHLFFHAYEIHETSSAFWEYRVVRKGAWIPFNLISACAVIGMFLIVLSHRSKDAALLYGLAATYLLSCLIFLVSSRYRGPAVPCLCLFAGYGIVYTFYRFRERRFLSGLAIVFVFLIILLLNTLPYRQQIGTMETSMQGFAAKSLEYRVFSAPNVNNTSRGKNP